jgi:hypothetical protein
MTTRMNVHLVVAIVIALLQDTALIVEGSTADHKYQAGEHVELWVNKVRWECGKAIAVNGDFKELSPPPRLPISDAGS